VLEGIKTYKFRTVQKMKTLQKQLFIFLYLTRHLHLCKK